jgi:hypothetical protein
VSADATAPRILAVDDELHIRELVGWA